jgi:UV damage endonuclease UvdE
MSIGYACQLIGKEEIQIKGCILKNASNEKLRELINFNLQTLDAIIAYNIKNAIKLFRISSDIIPFGSHEGNMLNWREVFQDELSALGKKIKSHAIRVSMHPGQYTVLNSIHEDTVKKAICDIEYHCQFLDSLGLDSTSKIILHIGGAYQNKENSLNRFISNFRLLTDKVKQRIVIENDDKIFTIEDILRISQSIGTPVVFDYLHNELNAATENKSPYEWITICNKTWKECDGKQKIHYSQPNVKLKKGSHSFTIESNQFLTFYNNLEEQDIDIMLEVKDKNLSAMKCNHLIDRNLKITGLETEWALYKYYVLSASAALYTEIRQLLKNKENADSFTFYSLIETAQGLAENKGAQINAAAHVWGYIKNTATEKEKNTFNKMLQEYDIGNLVISKVKKYLFRCAKVRMIPYLLDSLYFYL